MKRPRLGMKLRVILAVLVAIAVVVLAGPGQSISAPVGAIGGTVGQPWTGERGVTQSVSTLMARQRAEDRRQGGRVAKTGERPEPRPVTHPKLPGSPTVEPRVASPPVGPKSELTAATSFLGAHRVADSTFVPPDSMGSVGPTQALVAVNGRIRVFDKNGNNPGVL